jgi:glycogen operon protein
VKNFLALTLLSVGTPMFLAGDEVRSSQRGNNNAYCRSDELCSFDWALIEKYAEVYRFTKHLIEFRLNRNLPGRTFRHDLAGNCCLDNRSNGMGSN